MLGIRNTCASVAFLVVLAGCGSPEGNSSANAGSQTGGGSSGDSTAVGGAGSATSGGASAGGTSAGGTNTGGTISNPGPTEPFEVATMAIDVAGGAGVTSKETYAACNVTVDGKGSFASFSGTAEIRGRGNSTWLWYEKKPYRLRLTAGASLLGLEQNRDWVLLANYRDPTFLMNSFVFELARSFGLPYVNHSRFVEVTLNGEYLGLYLLTEQIEEGSGRVAIDEAGGLLLTLDEDDGPNVVPEATNNFLSSVFELPVAVKHPKDPTPAKLAEIQTELAQLETAIQNADYDAVAAKLDVASLIDFLIIQELTYNVELVTPRSMYIHRDVGGRFVLGPVWDFDGGFDFDWTDEMNSHDYFLAQDLLLGADPARDEHVSELWVGMFENARFVSEFKARWAAVQGTLLSSTWPITLNYASSIDAALDRNAVRWPIGKDHATELGRLRSWLEQRIGVLSTAIAAYPPN